LVEAGAHEGRLASDILSWFMEKRPDLLSRLQYWILEPSPACRGRQQESLNLQASWLHWAADWSGLPRTGVHGIIFSNELLDAFPVFRLGWDAVGRRWFEWRVGWHGDRLEWTRSFRLERPLEEEMANAGWLTFDPALAMVFPDGFTVELCPAARVWWCRAASVLAQGKLLTLDYGFEAEEFLTPHRQQGTLRSYRSHHLTPDPLARPGEQDLTAHVNFSALQQTGESTGLRTECFLSQAAFLTQIASRTIKRPAGFGPWDQRQTRQFQTLTHPDHLGHVFRVLLQSR
jgi:SAM-dependent MidA family methyltransferase